jgi:hypothetical protein
MVVKAGVKVNFASARPLLVVPGAVAAAVAPLVGVG